MYDVYEDFNLTDYRFRLSYRDPKILTNILTMTKCGKCSSMLKSAMDDMELDYFEAKVKLPLRSKTWYPSEDALVMKHCHSIGLLPERFDLKYIGADGKEHQNPWFTVVISTMERFTAILIENYSKNILTWLAPQQVTVIPVSNEAHTD